MEDLYSKYCACGYRVSTDSRSLEGGEMFFALKGENFNGNDYALKAIAQGAAWAVVNEDSTLPHNDKFIVVKDSLKTLQDLAIWHRTKVKGGELPVIGLTGTNGKTTTKNLINAVLSRKFKVTATQGNLNNDIGVPLSILKITPQTDLAIIEMGANHPDDITKLVKISQPNYGLITNVGRAHLLGFGSFEGVKAAKGELYRWLGSHEGSLLFINEDDTDLREMSRSLACHRFGYGIKYQKAEILDSSAENPFLRIRLGDDIICTHLVGAYNATNVLAALAIGDYFGVPHKEAVAAVEAYLPVNNRSQMLKTEKNTLIVDAYNANPSSMNAAIENFKTVCANRKIALLGDMRELGAESLAEHEKVIKKLQETDIEAYLVGDEFRKALDALGCVVAGWFKSSDELATYLISNPIKDAVVLVKGSRGIQMEKTLSSL